MGGGAMCPTIHHMGVNSMEKHEMHISVNGIPADFPNPAMLREYARDKKLDRDTEWKKLENILMVVSELRAEYCKMYTLDHTMCNHFVELIRARQTELYPPEPSF